MPFLVETFTDAAGTDLGSHTPEKGGAPTKHAVASANGIISDANRLRNDDTVTFSGNDAWYHYVAATPASNEQDVYMAVVQRGGGADAEAWVGARSDSGAAGHDGYYVVIDNAALMTLYLTPGFTVLGSTYTIPFTNDVPVIVHFQVRDADKKVFVDGVERITSTNNAITRVGTVAILSRNPNSNTVGLHIDSITGLDAGEAGPSLTMANPRR